MGRVEQAEEYRRRAQHCVEIAMDLSHQGRKAKVLDMAQAWLRLAEQAEKNSSADLVYETPPPKTSEPKIPEPDVTPQSS